MPLSIFFYVFSLNFAVLCLSCKPKPGDRFEGSALKDTKAGFDEKAFEAIYREDILRQYPQSVAAIKSSLRVAFAVASVDPNALSRCSQYNTTIALRDGVSLGTNLIENCEYLIKVEVFGRKLDARLNPVEPAQEIKYFEPVERSGLKRRISKSQEKIQIDYRLCPTPEVQRLFKPRPNCLNSLVDVFLDIGFEPRKR